jgi:hypothetical protein
MLYSKWSATRFANATIYPRPLRFCQKAARPFPFSPPHRQQPKRRKGRMKEISERETKRKGEERGME